jgi:transcriptional regulator with XRE-family HTH domain
MTKNQILWEIYQKENCSQTEFAKKVGMNRTTNISLWLSDQKDISFEKLEDIANRLNYKLNINYK